MVKYCYHFSFICRQTPLYAPLEDVSGKCPAVGLQLFPGAEEVGVVGHVEHRCKLDPPRVARFALRFVDEDGDATVDGLGDLRVPLAPEDGSGAGVGVQEGDVF